MTKVKIPEKSIYQFDARDERVNDIIDCLNSLVLKIDAIESKLNINHE